MKLFVSILFIAIIYSNTPEYSKSYYSNKVLKSEGWMLNNKKVKYWYFYYSNGSLKSQGHFEDNKMTGYWHFYNESQKLSSEGHFENDEKIGWWKIFKSDTIEEVKYENSLKEGLSVHKINDKPVKAEYYVAGIRTHEWFSLKQFRKEYPKL